MKELRTSLVLSAEKLEQLTQSVREQGGYLVVHMPLPFQLPLANGFVSFWREDDIRQLELFHYPQVYLFNQGEPVLMDHGPEAKEVPPEIKSSYTVARFGMPVPFSKLGNFYPLTMNPLIIENSGTDVKPHRIVNDLVEEGLRALNAVIRAHRVVTWDTSIYPLSVPEKVTGFPADVPSELIGTLWDVRKTKELILGEDPLGRNDIELVGKFIHLLHMGEAADRTIASPEQANQIVLLASRALHGTTDPFFTAADLLRSARTRGRSGDHTASVIECVTAIEIHVGAILRLELQKAGYDDAHSDSVIARSGLKNLLGQHLSRQLSFSFDLGNPTNPVEHWYLSAYAVRNDIVHRGRTATLEEAQAAWTQSTIVVGFLEEKVEQASPG